MNLQSDTKVSRTATGKTIYANKVMFGTWNGIIMRRLCMGTILGWALIPWAIKKCLYPGKRGLFCKKGTVDFSTVPVYNHYKVIRGDSDSPSVNKIIKG